MLAMLLALAGCRLLTPAPDVDGPGIVALVVMDTVRADHTSLCGYERNTTPTLAGLHERGFQTSCDGVTPGSWTIPSHATFFTGERVPEHRADRTTGILPASANTTAETMRDRGYKTLLITANPTIAPLTGLTQGFDKVLRAPDLRQWRGRDVPDLLEETIDGKPGPWFIVVNLIDAHDPYPAVPKSVEWGPVQKELALDRGPGKLAFESYIRRTMTDTERETFRDQLTRRYDYGVQRADRALAMVLKHLRHHRFAKAGLRVAITSDHGEYLGEHNLLRHGCRVFEPVIRAPLAVYDSAGPVDLPKGPIGLGGLHSFMLSGEWKDARAPMSFSASWPQMVRDCRDEVAQFEGGQKYLWSKEWLATDLATDPGETHYQPSAPPSSDGSLDAWHQHLYGSREEKLSEPMREHLEALGYLEPEKTP